MALEYDLQSDADASSAELRSFFAAAMDGEVTPDGAILRPGLYVTARRVTPEDADDTTELFGFSHRVSATYRFSNLAEREDRDHNTAVMVSAVLAFTERYRGHGVLLFNGDIAVVQWSPEEVVFHSGWEEWSDLAEVTPLINGHALRPLPQPLL